MGDVFTADALKGGRRSVPSVRVSSGPLFQESWMTASKLEAVALWAVAVLLLMMPWVLL
jgi:hypothetical protein